MAAPASFAEQLRRRREAFTLALRLGCTPREAEDEIRKRRAQEGSAAIKARMAAKEQPQRPAVHAPIQPVEEPEERALLWYQKD